MVVYETIHTTKSILSEINEKYFRNRPAMLDEFENIIKNLNNYL